MNFMKRPSTAVRAGIVMIGLFLSVPAFAASNLGETLPLLPRPQQRAVTAGELILREGVPIVIAPSAPARVREIAEVLRDELQLSTGISAVITSSDAPAPDGAVSLKLVPGSEGEAKNPESYALKIAQNVEVSASDVRGLLWACKRCFRRLISPGRVRPRWRTRRFPISPLTHGAR